MSPNQRFRAIVQDNYLSDIENLNFNDARGSAIEINKWIQAATHGRIKNLVTADSVSNSIVLLINALYFEGAWHFQFNKTFTSGFTTGQGKRVDKTCKCRLFHHTSPLLYYKTTLFCDLQSWNEPALIIITTRSISEQKC